MAGREKIDWTALQAEWIVGNLSNVALAKKFGVDEKAIRKRAKAEGWVRDDGELYRKKVEQKLQERAAAAVRTEVRKGKAKAAAESEVSDLAAEAGAQVVESHRRDAREARFLVGILFGQLRDAATQRELLIEAAQQMADDEGEHSAEAKALLMKMRQALNLPSNASTARDLTVALKNLVYIERGAFGLDKPPKDSGGAAAVAYDVSF